MRQLVWFGGLWASGVLSVGGVAGLLHWALSSRPIGPAAPRGKEAATKALHQ